MFMIKREKRIKYYGLAGRNAGIKFVLAKTDNKNNKDAFKYHRVIHFGDDLIAYDAKLFEEMINVEKVGAWPVAYRNSTQVSFK